MTGQNDKPQHDWEPDDAISVAHDLVAHLTAAHITFREELEGLNGVVGDACEVNIRKALQLASKLPGMIEDEINGARDKKVGC